MVKVQNEKLLKWNKKDYSLNVFVYLINAIIITGIFILNDYLVGRENQAVFTLDIAKTAMFLILTLLTLLVMFLYFYFEERNFLKSPSNSQMLFLCIEIVLVLGFVTKNYIGIYIRPLTAVAILLLFLCNRKSAMFMHTIYCVIQLINDILCGTSFASMDYALPIVAISAGFLAIVCMDKAYSRLKLIFLSLVPSIPIIAYVLLTFIPGLPNDFVKQLICALASGPLAVVVLQIFLPFFEAGFKKVSIFKLAELTDHKAKLIKKMIQECPGTFNHSIIVSNIAEACATAIGEDALLARVCAYYHDIGKLRRPEFFKENQQGEENPHDDLTPELSANIIKSHTLDGYKLAIKNRIPKEIAEVCIQHHGTLPILYFYEKAKRYTDGEVDLVQYCYTGVKPKTKIAAILMIADGCEAAVRSISARNRENVKNVVRGIVNDRMRLGQFDECEITIKELNIIISAVVNNLSGIHHQRIEYPKASLDGVEADSVADIIADTKEDGKQD